MFNLCSFPGLPVNPLLPAQTIGEAMRHCGDIQATIVQSLAAAGLSSRLASYTNPGNNPCE
jgi:hypothetical protein